MLAIHGSESVADIVARKDVLAMRLVAARVCDGAVPDVADEVRRVAGAEGRSGPSPVLERGVGRVHVVVVEVVAVAGDVALLDVTSGGGAGRLQLEEVRGAGVDVGHGRGAVGVHDAGVCAFREGFHAGPVAAESGGGGGGDGEEEFELHDEGELG